MTFGEELKKLLKEKEMTQRQLARKTGISEPTISTYARGVTRPSNEYLGKIEKVLKVSFKKYYEPEEYNRILEKNGVSIGYVIKKKLRSKNMSQYKLANLIEVNPEVISLYVNNKRIPNKKTLKKLQKVLGISVDEFKIVKRTKKKFELNKTLKEYNYKEIGQRIGNIMKDKGITKLMFGIKIRISEDIINRYLHGNIMPKINVLVKMSDALECSIDEICGRKINDERKFQEVIKTKRYGTNLRRILDFRGITVKELEEATSVTSVTIERFMNGKNNLRLINIARIADALQISIDKLIGR